MEPQIVTPEDIQAAAKRIAPYIRRTPLLRQEAMGKLLGCDVYLKPEMLQITGAFKLRGAMSKILSLTPQERSRGIITSSSGNHGQACAYAGEKLGIPVTVIVPEDTPHLKVANARRMGARVILWDRLYVKRWEKVREEVAQHGYAVVHPYEDPLVMAGQGTIAMEVLEDLPDLDTIVVPVGGGGLISGISTYVKSVRPSIRVVGVQAEGNDSYVRSRAAGEVTEAPCTPTVADGLSCRRPGDNPLPIIERYVDELVSVSEADILRATKLVAQEAKLVGEPSACVGVAAVMAKKFRFKPAEKICFVLTSGNWDIDILGRIYNDMPVSGVNQAAPNRQKGRE